MNNIIRDKKEIDDSVLCAIDNISKSCVVYKPLVAIRCITYNHGPYIRDALEGFVMQQTNFPFVAIVHDDASTDNTAEIIKEYAEKYPEIIKPIFETENQYSKHDGSLRKVMDLACETAGAKYIALCEGDDYWTNPLKLQKQVDFLEAHPDYSMCFGNAIEHWEDGSSPDAQFSDIQSRDYLRIEFIENWIVPTATVVYKTEVLKSPRRKKLSDGGKLIAGDILMFLTCFDYGKIKGFEDVFSVYRRLRTGAVISNIDKFPYKFLIHEITLGKAFGKEILKYFKYKTGNRVVLALKDYKDNGVFNFKYIFRALRFAPFHSIKQIIHYL